MLGIFILSLILSIVKCDGPTTPYTFTGVEIPNCTTAPSTSDSVTNVIHCTGATVKALKLSDSATDVEIHSVTYKSKEKAVKASLCKTISTSPAKYEIDPKADVKNIIYTHGDKIKVVLVGETDKCYDDILLKVQDIKSGYVQIETIACFETAKVTVLTKLADKNDIAFPAGSGNTCFVAPLLTTPVEAEFTIGTEKFKAFLSAYPKKKCDPCPNSAKT